MNRKIRVVHVVGARPNFMKMAPVYTALGRYSEFEQVLIHTGQHYDAAMSDVFFRELGLPEPAVNLEIGSGTHSQQTAQVVMRFEPVLNEYRPDWVSVPGDVNSTIACALVAAKMGIRIAHVEAGLRSFDRGMPEEINRVLTDQISDALLTPSVDGNENLFREGIAPEKIHLVGNVMIDTLIKLLPKADDRWPALKDLWDIGDDFIVATLHRPSNVDDTPTLNEILLALNDVAARYCKVLFPVHPRTRQRIAETFKPHRNLVLMEPLGYIDFLALQKRARLVLTDSGGVQEETTFLGVPCLTARPNTERPVTITMGTNSLVASRREAILEAVEHKLSGDGSKHSIPPLWDGHAGERIAQVLQKLS
jgi:UDP-N-acetylglucosamine 2-epimerase (non-hydrolysing)